MSKTLNYTVIRDSNEKEGYGWMFSPHPEDHRPPRCNGTKIESLMTGDYTLVGYTDILSIERKLSFSELWGNYNKDKKRAFESECERLSNIKYAYILIESHITPEIFDLSPPQFKIGVPGKALLKWLFGLGIKYHINIMGVGSCGKKTAQLIFEEIVRIERRKCPEE